MKILIVEDNAHKQVRLENATKKILGEETKFTTVTNLRSVYPILIDQEWDLILLDMTLHASDGVDSRLSKESSAGIEVLQALKSEQKSYPVIVMTQHDEFATEFMTFKSVKELGATLKTVFAENCIGTIRVRLNDEKSEWEQELRELINSIDLGNM